MSTVAEIEQLRARARALCALSTRLGASRVLVLHRLAGPDTWVGPTPQSCYDALVAVRRQLQTHQQALHDIARTLERRADELARQSAIHALVS